MAADNKLLGQFDLVGLAAGATRRAAGQVTFDIDANASSPCRRATRRPARTADPHPGVRRVRADIQRMVKEAEANAEADKRGASSSN